MITRKRLKKTLVYFFIVFTWPFSLLSFLVYKYGKSERIFATFAQLLSLVPGHIGRYLRASYYLLTLQKCATDVSIGFCSFFAHPNAEVGNHVVISAFSIIGTVTLGDSVLIAARASVMSGGHQHRRKAPDNPNFKEKSYFDRVFIGSNTWIGEGAIVMANVGTQCVVGAGSVVTRNMPNHKVAIGNPAKYLPREVTNV